MIVQYKQKTQVFATYNFARLKFSEQPDGTIIFKLKKGQNHIKMTAKQVRPVTLVGPRKHGEMTLDVPESLESIVHLEIYEGQTRVYEGTSTAAGFEWMYLKKTSRSRL